ncbi:hypothetical protein PHYBLDRAFT_157444 [Phycomyces blakesleeanus NRRL 1555(-)]|uniref:Uncharacterized protein n=1 Tax=Phycomyces blakesleeanus (strain ATCC 8743b / DSM 1359 / FGSC 10004 / NBRC 33097 / NRRL 1555) TaxID=763407 RepID=A0A167QR56_PHYB8|nr:hypothetical protein PHYBLDRAFT_157444 [Phycomyces blakesleeanus NRRL 1555(-)]OAD80110.1 hypothetical protein PHYBLDRAFT_157444 [Phycomyces blakesleeanus NRRL 1555(-)]|eukprot:XP_018298150.1 hypothetical protein PHYBLDRAFT_157444 [Phycomyces blakesleeanus NRRL 1555(-)]
MTSTLLSKIFLLGRVLWKFVLLLLLLAFCRSWMTISTYQSTLSVDLLSIILLLFLSCLELYQATTFDTINLPSSTIVVSNHSQNLKRITLQKASVICRVPRTPLSFRYMTSPFLTLTTTNKHCNLTTQFIKFSQIVRQLAHKSAVDQYN